MFIVHCAKTWLHNYVLGALMYRNLLRAAQMSCRMEGGTHRQSANRLLFQKIHFLTLLNTPSPWN
jgi:hypothetical protein